MHNRRRPTTAAASSSDNVVAAHPNAVPPILRRASLLAGPHHGGGLSGVTSQQGTSRLDADAVAAAAAATTAWAMFNDAQRLQYILSGTEAATVADAFHRGAGSYVTLASLRGFLTPIGVAVPSNDALLEEKVRRAMQLELAFRHGAPPPLPQPHQHCAAAEGGLTMQRAAMKVLSARRLSARRASQASTPKQAALVPPQAAAAASRPVVIPATLSLDIIMWLMRVLKDDVEVLAASSAAADNPDTMEAFKSCASEATGIVTLKSVQEKCKLFDVVLDVDARRGDTRGGGGVDDSDDDRDDEGNARHRPYANNTRLRAATAAAASLYGNAATTAAGSEYAGVGEASAPTPAMLTSPCDPQPPSAAAAATDKTFASDDRGDGGNVLTPRGFAELLHITEDRRCQQQQRSGGSGSSPQSSRRCQRPATAQPLAQAASPLSQPRMSPRVFVSVPYTDAELDMFQAAEDALRFSGGSPAVAGECGDAQQYINALLGEAPIAIADAMPGGGTVSSLSTLPRRNTLRRAQKGALAAMSIKYSGGGDASSLAEGVSSIAPVATEGMLGIDGGGGMPSPASPSNHGGTSHVSSSTSRMLTQQYFLRHDGGGSGGGDHRPASAPELTTVGGYHCARHDEHHQHFHAAQQRAQHGTGSGLPPQAQCAAGGAGAAFVETFDTRRHEAHHSALDITPQAKGHPMVSLGVANHYVPGGATLSGGSSSRSHGGSKPPSPMTAAYSSAQHPTHTTHIADYQLSDMIEKQNALQKAHPIRAALLGDYYHSIAKERSASAAAACGLLDGGGGSLYGSATYSAGDDEKGGSVGQRLDIDFPLNGASWAALEHHGHRGGNRLKGQRGGQAATQPPPLIPPTSVFSRLTRLHQERPAIALYRLQQELERLEASRRPCSASGSVSPTTAANTSVERLRRFRAGSASTIGRKAVR